VFVWGATHSPLLLGVLAFSNFVPVLLLVPWTGSAADRFDRRRLLLATQIAATALTAALAALTWAGYARVWVVMLFAVGLGVTAAFATPAAFALIGGLVPREELGTAVGLNSMTYNLARAIGPVLAAVAVTQLGIAASFAINSASYLALVVGVLVVHPAARRGVARGESRLREGLKVVRERPVLLASLLIVAAVGFASDPVNTESPAFAHAFGKPAAYAGFIIGAFGAGAVTAAFVLAGRFTGSRRRMALTLGLLGGGLVAFCLVRLFPVALAVLVVAGFGYLASNTSATSRLQLGVEEHLRGRMMALWSVAFLGLRPVASLIDGALAEAFGVRVAGIVLALPALLGAAAILVLERRRSSYSAITDY
jgi:MFS family permease